MDYGQALDYIHKTLNFSACPGLSRISELCSLLGNPQDKLKFIHVAGTNGKGSTVTMIACALEDAGYTVGKYTSPYVYDFRERIEVNGVMIEKEALARLTGIIAHKCDMMEDHPTEFEMVTALSFLYFLEKKCDYVVLEVGLGGRLDATNIIKNPIVSVICSISLDHVKILGDTEEKIAFEKAGIIKKGCPCAVYAANSEPVNRVFETVCRERNSKLYRADISKLKIKSTLNNKNVFEYKNVRYSPAMLGKHQIYNALSAITALEVAGIDSKYAASGIARAVAHGRYELLCQKPRILLDAGHNKSGIDSLIKAVRNDRKIKSLTVVFGMLRDKDYPYAIRELATAANKMICISPDSPRALEAEKASELAGLFCSDCQAFYSIRDAVSCALRSAGDGTILICGSFYLIDSVVSEFKKQL